MTVADAVPVENGAVLKQDGKELNLTILSPENLGVSIVSLDPPPLKIDKKVKNLKRVEIRVPVDALSDGKGVIRVRLSGK